ncbi:MAG: OmpA family protein [Pseudomonadota bacterium]|jgi:OOP family OmpA-OmpF porin|uniref:OmpA family protein n=1 Tax=Qipengyuania flava TaxID=192812 RepID=A0A5P6NGC8_9SPHN|nr:OmpA family protein [Qipengyuania flava]MEC7533776.1 OmpA family protein [Pseudomonadota bacterium]MBO9505390.1 OmpA family protein [Qipengyuania flava]MBW3169008.1 OmpA family protein [Qipengyuania flava]MBY5966246.1 OmpA family protein [Qipengyuania flava]MBY6012570.1 OmpA family protein [Qipengyuania flava]
MPIRPSFAILAGAVVCVASAYALAERAAPGFVERLETQSDAAIADAGGEGVSARFVNINGSPTRHPVLEGGGALNEATRARVARAVYDVPGVGGVVWSDGTLRAESDEPTYQPLHCQEDVEGLLRTRSIRFEEASSALLPASRILLDEVAEALRPCLGSIIAITGHTDKAGTEPGNLALSMERARVVREALVRRGIPRDGLRASGVGSSRPVEGLAPSDPANRRIEFSVIRTEPLRPTPVDTPGAR